MNFAVKWARVAVPRVCRDYPRTSPKILYWRIFARVTMKQAMVRKAM
jgi:hypothetical protein